MPNTVIQLKKSATVSAKPSDLANGELAINFADGKLFYKNTAGMIAEFSSGSSNFGTVNAGGTLVVSDTPGDVLTLLAGNNITVTGDAVNDRVTIGLTNDVTVAGVLSVRATGGDEGGQIELGNAITNSTLAGSVIIDVYQNKLRFFEKNSPNKGAFIDLSITGSGASTNLLASSGDTTARATAEAAFAKANAALPNTTNAVFDGNLVISQNLRFVGSNTRVYSTPDSLYVTNGAITNRPALVVEAGAGTGGISVGRGTFSASFGHDSGSQFIIGSTNWGGVSFTSAGNINHSANNGMFRFGGDANSYGASNGVIQVIATPSVGYYIRFTKDGLTTTNSARPNDVFTVSYAGDIVTSGNTRIAGSVGIGTTSPGERLHINSGSAEFAIQWDSTGSKSWVLASATNRAYIRNKTDSVEALTILNAGNVGIGTNNPTYRLVAANSTTDGGWINTVSANSFLGLGGYSSGSDGAFSIRYERATGEIVFSGGTRDTPIERMRITSTGRVGIGTASPAQALQVNSAIRVTAEGTNSIAELRGGNIDGAVLQLYRAGNTSQFAAFSQYQGALFIKNIDSGATIFTNTLADTERMRITPAGRVGIGTTSPNTVLDIRGTVQGRSYSIPDTGGSAQWVRIGRFTAPQTGCTIKIRAYIHAGYNAQNSQDFYLDLYFKTSNGSTLDGSGFAGNSWYYTHGFNAHNPTPKWVGNAAGTSATSYELFLNLPVYTNDSHYIAEIVDDSAVIWTDLGNTGQSDPGSSSNTVCVSTAGFNIPIGNVGIGRIDPTYKLDVVGTINASNVLINGSPISAGGGGAASVTISDSAPSSPTANSLWWSSDLGKLFIYYNDGSSNQWVETSPSPDTTDIFNTANIAINTANTARDIAILSYGRANTTISGYDAANTAQATAVAAFNKANTAVTTGKAIAMAIVFG